jgi:cytoskeleton protein RodZ
MARGIFGERLKRERELREVTLEEITSATRIGARFLEALENEDWAKLPGGVFNRGFVRSVARYLGLDEEGLLSEYDMAHGTRLPPANGHPQGRIPSPPGWLPAVMLFGVLALLAGLIAGGVYTWKYFAARRSVKQSLASGTPALPQPAVQVLPSDAAASSSPPNSSGTPATAPLDLLVSATATTQVRIQADGTQVFDNDLRSGEHRHFTANQEFQVSAADSSAVLLELNGQTMPPLGVPGGSGTIKLSRKDLRHKPGGNSQP